MISSVYSNLSALQAHGKKMGATSNNIANNLSDDYKKKQTHLLEGYAGSVDTSIVEIDTPGPIIEEQLSDNEVRQRELSNVDLGEEIASTIPTQRGYEANTKAIQAYDDMLGTVIDMKK